MQNNKELLDSAMSAAKLAALHMKTVERPSDPSSWGEKGTSDFVTQVDRDCEQLIADSLLHDHPDSVIMGEELSPQTTDKAEGVTWVVDPLDGTTNYLHDYLAYAVSIAALVDGVLSVGVVIDVPKNKIYHTTSGGGAWCENRRIHVSATTETALALIGTGFPFKSLHLLPRYLEQFATILKATSGIRRAGAAALDLVDLASGRLDGFWELSLAPWDVAAGTLLIREAGGVVTNSEGHSNVIRQGPVIAGNPAIYSWLFSVVNGEYS